MTRPIVRHGTRLTGAALLAMQAACGGDLTSPWRSVDKVPACADPTPLYGTFDPRVPQYIVILQPTPDVKPEVARLAAKYGFTTTTVWESGLQGFVAPITSDIVAGLRCETTVKYVSHDQVFTLD
jgi:hypothetical protein